jgi:hypothetical protein
MKTEQTKMKKSIDPTPSKTEQTIKIVATTIILIVGCWMVLKLSKEMLKELEGMGL